jgi:hypothetical protein
LFRREYSEHSNAKCAVVFIDILGLGKNAFQMVAPFKTMLIVKNMYSLNTNNIAENFTTLYEIPKLLV